MKNKKLARAIFLITTACCLSANAVGSDLPALKDVFKDYFLIGGAYNRNLVAGRDPGAVEIAIHHNNTATPENDMKWSLIHPRPSQYNWEPADRFMEFCRENDMVPIGHTLVWHSQVPGWVFQDDSGGTLDREALLARMKDHISAVVGRYKGRIKGWDVVNEALNDDGTLRNTQWLRIIGEGNPEQQYDYIAKAFQYAHEADPDVELYYNDYSLSTSRAKADGAAAIVKHLQSKGIRVDGVGMQVHAGLTWPSVEDLEYAITTLAATGVKVMVTELDIRTRPMGYRGADIARVGRGRTAEESAEEAAETQRRLAEKYAEIFSVLVKHKDVIPRVTFWGVYDATSWIQGSPLLFDREYQPKQAFHAVVNVVRGDSSGQAQSARNPIIWADVPDVAAIRVDDTYYMASTTMHMSPGLPLMKSKDLINWELVSYAYDTLADNEALRLENGRNAYGRGSWAPCLRYHNGTFYASTFSATSGRTHIYTAKNIEGPWKEISFRPSLHDHSLVFDDDGRVYMLYGVGNLRLTELEPELSGIKEGGFNEVVIPNASAVAGPNINLQAEGSQVRKINGMYYVMNITWPRGGMRTTIIHRAEKITGPYESKLILQDQGVAQGCLLDTPDGEWYALLFQDNGAVGRSPWLVPVKWEDGWPVLGVDGKAPRMLDIKVTEQGLGNIVASDEFDRAPGEPLPLAWQWNHNPDYRYWSIGERPGYLRLTTGRVDTDVLQARNMLTQRTFGPVSSASTRIEVANMKDGDYAGLIALQRGYGSVYVKMEGDTKSIAMFNAGSNRAEEVESIPLTQEIVYFRIDCDFRNRTDKAYFYYSLDGKAWTRIGTTLQMSYTLPHFMGYRFGLFNFATKSTGGFVDFDYYRISDEIVIGD